MTYAKHIDEIETLKYACDGQYDECLGAAIDLMQAADAPTDIYYSDPGMLIKQLEVSKQELRELRTALGNQRTELTAAQTETDLLRVANRKREQERDAAQAEIERLRSAAEEGHRYVGSLEAKLTILCAAAERLDNAISDDHDNDCSFEVFDAQEAVRAAIESVR